MYRIFLVILFISVPSLVYASVAGEVNKANALYGQGKFDDSFDLYQEALDKDDKSPIVKYDIGTDLYKKGDYAKALGYLEQAANDKNIKIKPKAEYNIGNVLYKAGAQKEKTDIDQAIKSMQQALKYYGEAITEDPKDQEAKFNQDFVKKEIERLKQKKQQQKNQQQQNQQGQQNQQNKQDQSKQRENQQKNQQQNQQQKQQQEQQQQNQQQSQSQPQEQKQKSAQDKAGEEQKELDRKQAEDLLEDYRENEEPKKLLNYMPKKIDDRPVLKDW